MQPTSKVAHRSTDFGDVSNHVVASLKLAPLVVVWMSGLNRMVECIEHSCGNSAAFDKTFEVSPLDAGP
jgi:hypothetical protein